ncbi:hypothetical protein MINT15_40890 [Saccharomonospora viridis]|uniref:Uncharacterized protein n=1 Tax=Saccharomonospora viridis TaxID=1852 RepID=A0A837D3F3_9PSEU|nr:hypothetical protein MINT15_40890 [Saccharomonospora viridis]
MGVLDVVLSMGIRAGPFSNGKRFSVYEATVCTPHFRSYGAGW